MEVFLTDNNTANANVTFDLEPGGDHLELLSRDGGRVERAVEGDIGIGGVVVRQEHLHRPIPRPGRAQGALEVGEHRVDHGPSRGVTLPGASRLVHRNEVDRAPGARARVDAAAVGHRASVCPSVVRGIARAATGQGDRTEHE